MLNRGKNCGFICTTYKKFVTAVNLTMEKEQILSSIKRPTKTRDKG